MTQLTVRLRSAPGAPVLKRAIEPATRRGLPNGLPNGLTKTKTKASKHIGYTMAGAATPAERDWFIKHGANEIVSEELAKDGLTREMFFSKVYPLEAADVLYLLAASHVPDQYRAELEGKGVKIVVIGYAPEATKGARFVSITPKPKPGQLPLNVPAALKPGKPAPKATVISAPKPTVPGRTISPSKQPANVDALGLRGPAKVDPLQRAALSVALGATKSLEPRSVVKFERSSRVAAKDGDLFACGMGVQRKAPSVVFAYGGYATDDATIEKLAKAGTHEFRREAKTGRGVRAGILFQASKGDVILVSSLRELCVAQDLPAMCKSIESRGVSIVSLDGADSRTKSGRAFIAMKVIAVQQLYGGLRY